MLSMKTFNCYLSTAVAATRPRSLELKLKQCSPAQLMEQSIISRSDPKTWQNAFLAHRQSRLVQKHILRGHIFQDYGKVGKTR